MQNTNIGIKVEQDTLILNDIFGQPYVFSALGIGDAVNLERLEDTTTYDVGVNGISTVARNARGRMYTLTVVTPISSADDLMLEAYDNATTNNLPNIPFINGTYTRISSNSLNTLTTTTYQIFAGVMKKGTGLKTNSTGDNSQMYSTWEIQCQAIRQSS